MWYRFWVSGGRSIFPLVPVLPSEENLLQQLRSITPMSLLWILFTCMIGIRQPYSFTLHLFGCQTSQTGTICSWRENLEWKGFSSSENAIAKLITSLCRRERFCGFPADSITVQWYNCIGTDVPDDSAVNSIFNIHFEEGREECTIDLKFFSLKLLNKNK